MSYDDEPSLGTTMRWIIGCGVALLVVVALFVLVGMGSLPWQMDKEREATQHSRQYITSTQEDMLSRVDDYQQLNTEIAQLKNDPANQDVVEGKKEQQRVILAEVRHEAATIPPEEVPVVVSDFLASHKND